MRNYFSPAETKCKCGCGRDILPKFRKTLNEIRTHLGAPMYVNSGMRCPTYNATIPGSSPSSYHTLGMAVDIGAIDHGYRRDLLDAILNGPSRKCSLILYPGFIHIDIRHSPVILSS